MAACQEAAKPFTYMYFSLQIAGHISCLGDAFGVIRDNIQIVRMRLCVFSDTSQLLTKHLPPSQLQKEKAANARRPPSRRRTAAPPAREARVMDSLARVPSRHHWQDFEKQRQSKKDALRDWLASQPNEVLVESLLRGVLSPSTLAEIVRSVRKAYDEEHGNIPSYKNLQVNGTVDGVKIGLNGLRVFTSDGRQAGKVIGFEPAPLPAPPRVSPRFASDSPGGLPGASSAIAGASTASPKTEPSVKAQGKRPAKAMPAPKVTPGAFVVRWASKPASARNTYDGTTELFSLEALQKLTWHRLAPSATAAGEGDWRITVFEGFLEDVQRHAIQESDRPVRLWLHLSPPMFAALEQMIRFASVVDSNNNIHLHEFSQTACLKVLSDTKEIEISMSGHRAVVPAPALMHVPQPPTLGASLQPPEAKPVLAFSIPSLLLRNDVVGAANGAAPKAGLVGSFLQIRAEPESSATARTRARSTLIHLYLPPLLPLYVWVLQRKGLDRDTVQHVVRFLLLRFEIQLDGAALTGPYAKTVITHLPTLATHLPTLAPAQPAVAIALSSAQLNTIVKHVELFSIQKGYAAQHRAVQLTVLLRCGSTHGLVGKALLSLAFSGNSGVECDDHNTRRVVKSRVVWKSLESDVITWPREVPYRALQATFNVSDGSHYNGSTRVPYESSLVDALLNAAPQAHATLCLCPPHAALVGETPMEDEDGLLSLQLTLPKGGHLTVVAPLVSWMADPPA